MVTQDLIDKALAILHTVAPGGAILAVPDSVAFGDNPAITLKLPLTVTTYKKQLVAPEVVKYVDPALNAQWLNYANALAVDTILVNEGIVASQDRALKSAVIWHEQGHVLNTRTESGNVYLFEVQSLQNAVADLGANNVQRIVQSRVPQYRMAVDPGKTALSNFVQATWGIQI